MTAVTINLKTCEIVTLDDIIDVQELSKESILSDYTKIHRDSFITSENIDHFIQNTDCIQDFLDGNYNDNFFMSDESESGIFIILRGDAYYLLLGQ
jgi:hypothetical protein